MPAAVTHVVLGQKIHQQFFSHLDFPAFIVGTNFPDIRYISELTRTGTHLDNQQLKDINTKDPFLAGFQVHSLVDQIINIINHKQMQSYSLEINTENVVSFKFYQDKILYSKIDNWPQIKSFFDRVYPQETNMGVSKERVQEWHVWLQEYFINGANKKLLNGLSKLYNQPELGKYMSILFKKMDQNTAIKKDILQSVDNIISLIEKE